MQLVVVTAVVAEYAVRARDDTGTEQHAGDR